MPTNQTKPVEPVKKETGCLKVKTSLRAGGDIPKNDTIDPQKHPPKNNDNY